MWRRRIVVGVGPVMAAGIAVCATVAAPGDAPRQQDAAARAARRAGSIPGPRHELRAGGGEPDLTEQQRDGLRQIEQCHRDELRALGECSRSRRRVLQDTIASGEVDEAAIRAKVVQVAAGMADGAASAARIGTESRPAFTAARLPKPAGMQDDRRQAVDRWLEDTARRAGTKDAG